MRQGQNKEYLELYGDERAYCQYFLSGLQGGPNQLKKTRKKDGEKNKDERQNSLFVDNIIVWLENIERLQKCKMNVMYL